MKKSLLTLGAALLLSAGAFAQVTSLTEDHDKVTPCFTAWEPAGNYQWSPGHEISSMTTDFDNSAIVFTSKAHAEVTHAEAGPAYYSLSTFVKGNGSDIEDVCNAGTGIVDISATPKFKVKIKASAPVKFRIYIQQGNSPSWNYARLSSSTLDMDLTTEYQEFTLDNISATSVAEGKADIDLTKIGGLAFSTELNAETFDGTITIDYFKLGDAVVALTEAEIAALNVKVFPNPASDVVNVSYNAPADESVVVTLSNSLGQQVASVAGSSSNASIDVAGLNAGLYFASVVVDGVVVSTQKVIVE